MFSWEDFLTLADRLQSPQSGEAEQRTAISRAYYAAHHISKVFCAMNGISVHLTATGTDHKEVIKALKCQSDSCLRKAGKDLDVLLGWRTKADYSDTVKVDLNSQAKYLVALARGLVTNLKNTRKP